MVKTWSGVYKESWPGGMTTGFVLSAVDFSTHTVVVVGAGSVAIITVPGGTVCEGVTVYVVPFTTAVMVVPAVTPVPERIAPTTNGPPAVRVSVVP